MEWPIQGLPAAGADEQRRQHLEQQVAGLVDLDWDLIIRNQAAWTSRFNREIGG